MGGESIINCISGKVLFLCLRCFGQVKIKLNETSMEGELQAETHQEEITSLVRKKGASSKKP